jgi:selenide,water dikinase
VDLGSLLKTLEVKENPDLIVGFDTSDDAGVFRISEDLALVQTVDFITPVSDDPYAFGQVAAANSLSDVYAMGGRPLTALNICCFPPKGVPEEVYGQILTGSLSKVIESGASLIGGHTVKDEELKYGLAVTGTIHPDRVLKNSGAKPGDALILTKPLGTGVMITGSKRGLISPDPFFRVVECMAQLNKEAAEAALAHRASACTDVTGFAMAGHALEMARGSMTGLRLRSGSLPRFPEALDLIRQGVRTGVTSSNRELVGDAIRFDPGIDDAHQWLLFDPQTSGGLLISVPAEEADSLLRDLHARGIAEAGIVGEVFASKDPVIEVTA